MEVVLNTIILSKSTLSPFWWKRNSRFGMNLHAEKNQWYLLITRNAHFHSFSETNFKYILSLICPILSALRLRGRKRKPYKKKKLQLVGAIVQRVGNLPCTVLTWAQSPATYVAPKPTRRYSWVQSLNKT